MAQVLKLTYKPYTLKLKHPFTIANYSRRETPIVLTEIEYAGDVGYGEASLPQYLGETQESVIKFLSKVDLTQFKDPMDINNILNYVDSIEECNNAAKASLDIALHDIAGKLMGIPLYKFFGLKKPTEMFTSYTIGIDSNETINKKIDEASGYKYYKIKLGAGNDKEIIETIRNKTDSDLFVDVNQGWNDKNYALDMIEWLSERNVIFVEQPLPKENVDDIAWLNEKSRIPIIADEAVIRLIDIVSAKDIYSGINIKLMKSTGLREALAMINKAKDLGLKIMLGCMTETSCAVTAAAHLSSLVDWLDLDGPLLIKNDIFKGLSYSNGKIILQNLPGIGIEKK
ncbi:MAG: dipeptide epimerase [Ignavibacterium sp.]|nr:MAG: dipeptide epimerase [Ignavibacterium sp.]